MPTDRFEGFADRKGAFFAALAKHQDREWFAAHKAEYDEGWAKPLGALLAEAREAVDDLYPDFELGDAKVFRIHRDVRFSADKSPYKTHAGGLVPLGHAKVALDVSAALYVQVGKESFAAAGMYGMGPEALARYRAAVADDKRGKEIEKIVLGLVKKGFSLDSMETLKKVPRGFEPDHPRAELLKRKGLIVMFPKLEPADLVSRKILTTIVKHAKAAAPFVRWVAGVAEGR